MGTAIFAAFARVLIKTPPGGRWSAETQDRTVGTAIFAAFARVLIKKHLRVGGGVPRHRIELWTPQFSVACSTN